MSCASSTSQVRTSSTAAPAWRQASAFPSARRAARAGLCGHSACTELILSTPDAASNPTQAIGQVTTYLQAHTGVNAVMALNSAIGDALVAANPAKVKIATFDLDTGTIANLKAGTMDFAIDQQQYLQGYLPIVFLYLYNKHEGNSSGGGSIVLQRPLVVTKANVGQAVGRRYRRRRRLSRRRTTGSRVQAPSRAMRLSATGRRLPVMTRYNKEEQ